MIRIMILWYTLFPLLISSVISNNGVTSLPNEVNHGEILFEWLRSRGGYVNPKLEVRRVDPADPNSKYGMFTKEDLKLKERLIDIPSNTLITDNGAHFDDDEEYGAGLNCRTVENLLREMRLGEASEFSPYLDFMAADDDVPIPSGWSAEGKRLLNNLLEYDEGSFLPPEEATLWIETDWKAVCEGGDDAMELKAALAVVKRGWGGTLKPVYDMMRHRNGDYWYNTEDNSHKESDKLKVRTKRDVKAGEELYASVNMCKKCAQRNLDNYGTPEIFRDYGIVEQYPQSWYFPAHELGFEITESEEGGSKKLVVVFDEEADDEDAESLYEIKTTLSDAAETLLKNPSGIWPRELSAIESYHQAMMLAVTLALEMANDEKTVCPAGAKTCPSTFLRFEDLMKNTPDLLYQYTVCDNVGFYSYTDYEWVQSEKSAYQEVNIMHNDKNNDVCLELDNITQQCTNYRPHYHEPIVHFTARFHENIKRVVFVGGGDSMLLHEILKYPSLELVVGLELDQSVTRTAFKYFGSQPHWDNEKVEWWYGDACKSLLMLPKEYFGSFDMVLVDLSETVMALSVTKELDIFQALSLLLTPEGSFVKNEQYFEKMVDIFVHTIQVHYYDVPVICSQALAIGSNKNNYLQNKLTDHNLDSKNLFVKPLDGNEHYGIVHDYEYNPSNLQQHCKEEENVTESDELQVQTNSPGIVIIMDVEDASLATQPLQEIEEVLKEVLEKQGLTVLSVVTPSAEEADTVIIIFLKEGFVVSRMWSEHKYVAFDIHFWSSFEKQRSLKNALFACAGSVSGASSSYRIVAGGMFGLSTWKEDEKRRGPHKTISCDTGEIESTTQSDQDNVAAVILKESMKFVPDEEGIIVVVCGHEASQPCKSAETLQNVDKTFVLWSCSSIDESKGYSNMDVCRDEVLESLKKLVKDVPKIQTIVLDSTVPHAMGQVLFKILKKKGNTRTLLSQNVSVFAISPDEKKTWQENFIDRTRKDVVEFEPVFKAKCLFKGPDTTTALYVMAADELFIPKLNDVRFSVEEKTGLVSTIEDLYGGQVHHAPGMAKYNGANNFSLLSVASDYDVPTSFEQWSSQKPLEQQTIFQLELNNPNIKLSANEIKDALSKTLDTINSLDSPDTSVIKEFAEVGDGCVLVTFWSGSRVILTWDGRAHLDINFSTLAQNVEVANKFSERFLELVPTLNVVLKDKQPRGYGRVINFLGDISNFTPYWANN